MLQKFTPSKHSSYLVPCVFKAVHMIEALRENSTGLRVDDLHRMTGYSRTTIYRILRTLAACGYIRRDPGGSYRLNCALVPAVGERLCSEVDSLRLELPPKLNRSVRTRNNLLLENLALRQQLRA